MPFRIETLSPDRLRSARRQILSLYFQVFSAPPWNEEIDLPWFSRHLSRQARYPGFKCILGWEENSKSLAGFAYGYTSTRSSWFHRQVAPELHKRGQNEWLADCFEFAELAVAPEFRQQGLGTEIYEALLSGLPHRTSLLVTLMEDHPALRLYLHQGWQILIDDCPFLNPTDHVALLGKELV